MEFGRKPFEFEKNKTVALKFKSSKLSLKYYLKSIFLFSLSISGLMIYFANFQIFRMIPKVTRAVYHTYPLSHLPHLTLYIAICIVGCLWVSLLFKGDFFMYESQPLVALKSAKLTQSIAKCVFTHNLDFN